MTEPGGADATAGLTKGIAGFLSGVWNRPVRVDNLAASSAGARRRNVSFDAHVEGQATMGLVVTIVPEGAMGLNTVTTEAAMRTLARRSGVPVPEVVAVSEDASLLGGPFFISERVEGETVPRRVLRLVASHDSGERLASQLGAALARLHSIDPELAPINLIDTGTRPPAEAALQDLDTLISELGIADRPALALGMKWLERHLPAASTRASILHTDVRNGNLIVGPEGLRAILDWEGARRPGDPMEDLAWPALRMWRFHADELEIGGFSRREPFLRSYTQAGGAFDLDRFEWWKVLGTLRWAIGLYGQASAYLSGSFPSIVMAASGRRVPEMEWDLLMLIRP